MSIISVNINSENDKKKPVFIAQSVLVYYWIMDLNQEDYDTMWENGCYAERSSLSCLNGYFSGNVTGNSPIEAFTKMIRTSYIESMIQMREIFSNVNMNKSMEKMSISSNEESNEESNNTKMREEFNTPGPTLDRLNTSPPLDDASIQKWITTSIQMIARINMLERRYPGSQNVINMLYYEPKTLDQIVIDESIGNEMKAICGYSV